MAINKKTYIDFDIDFIKHPLSKDIVKVTDDAAIQQSIELLLEMDYFESPMQPAKGSNVKRLLFEPMGVDVVIELKEAITEVLENYEPRIDLKDVIIEADYDNGVYTVKIIFQILNNINLSVIEFILERVN